MQADGAVDTPGSKKKKILVIILTVIVVLLAVFAFLGFTDASKTELAQEWFGQPWEVTLAPDQNAFFLINGFGVPDGMAPIEQSSRWVEEENNRLRQLIAGDTAFVQIEPLPQAGILDSIKVIIPFFSSDSTVDIIRNRAGEIEALYQASGFLTERYEKLSSYSNYATPVIALNLTTWPTHVPLLRYQSLRLAHVVQLYDRGNHDEALEMLGADLALGRMLRRHADYMLLALYGTVYLHRSLQVIDVLLNVQEEPSPELVTFIENLPLLTPEEYSLRKALITEGWIPVNTLESANNRSFWIRLVWKKNATANLVAESHATIADLSELSGPEYMQQKDMELAHVCVLDRIRNIVGAMQLESAQAIVDYYTYTGFDLNGFLLLVKAKAAIRQAAMTPDEVGAFLEQNKDQFYNIFTQEVLELCMETQELRYTGPDQENQDEFRRVQLFK